MTEQPQPAAPSRTARARNAAADMSVKLESTALGRVWSRLLEVEFVDRSVALAAKAFVSLFPLLILVTALTPDSVRAELRAWRRPRAEAPRTRGVVRSGWPD